MAFQSRLDFGAVIWVIFPSLVPWLSHCIHLSIVYISPPSGPSFLLSPQFISLAVSGGAHGAWLRYVSWTNRGHISLAGNTILLWKCSVNYWARSKHPLCHFWLSYLCRANGSNAWLLSSLRHLICISWRNPAICSRSASVLGCWGGLQESVSHANLRSPCEFCQPLATWQPLRDSGFIVFHFSVTLLLYWH